MPLFRVYKDIFECIVDGSKTIEVRTRLLQGDTAVFLCGRNVFRKRIIKRQEFDLNDGFFEKNWSMITPKADSFQAAKKRLLEIFPNGTKFYAYFLD